MFDKWLRNSPGAIALVAVLLCFLDVPVLSADVTGPADSVTYVEDFNGDGAVNIADAIALLLLGRDDPSNPRADYNGDGGYMISDVIFLLINMRDNKLTPVEPEPEPDVKTYFIKGMVYCASGSFVNVTIMLQSADTTLTTLTDGSGIYYFNIPDGYYTIVPVYSGYGFDPILIEVLIKGEDLYNQNFLIYGYESVGGL